RSIQGRTKICGSYTIPRNIQSFPGSLVGEAVGQLAAWAAMAAVDFEKRPVAGLAGAVEMLAPVQPGQVIELEATLESIDSEAVSYEGVAHSGGQPVIRLQHCVGPMIPVQEFDDPAALRERFAVLCGAGAEPGGFGGIPQLSLERNGNQTPD